MTKVTINASDQDVIVLAGTLGPVFNINYIFNSSKYNNSATNLDKWKVQRYFPKSGTYKVKIMYVKGTDKAKVDIGLDSSATNIANQLDTYSATPSSNNFYETAITVGRGMHEVVILVNGKNASSTAFIFEFQMMMFNLVDEHTMLGEDGIAQINQGSMVLLAKHKCEIPTSTKTFDFADISNLETSKYSEIKIIINGVSTLGLTLQCTVNNLATAYFQDGHQDAVGISTNIDKNNLTAWELVSPGGNNKIFAIASFSPRGNKAAVQGFWLSGVDASLGQGGYLLVDDFSTKINTITIKTSASTLTIGTTIEIYGVRK